MSRVANLLIGLCVLGAAHVAWAQDPRLAGKLDSATFAAVTRLLDAAREQGLPTEPLVDKALEGAMKRAPGPRIVDVVSVLATRLATAREALAPQPSSPEIMAGADALAVGVPRDNLRQLRALRPGKSVAVPLAVLAQLVSRGVPVERASTMVVTLLKRGATAPQLVALSDAVQEDIAAGIAPNAAMDVRTRGVIATLPPLAPGSAATEALDRGPTATSTRPPRRP